jgi:hypothetical protein
MKYRLSFSNVKSKINKNKNRIKIKKDVGKRGDD